MFTIIKDWQRNSAVGSLTVNIKYILRLTKTGKTLYAKEGTIMVDTSIKTGNSALEILIGAIAPAINVAATDKVIAWRKCNTYVGVDTPKGRYAHHG